MLTVSDQRMKSLVKQIISHNSRVMLYKVMRRLYIKSVNAMSWLMIFPLLAPSRYVTRVDCDKIITSDTDVMS